MNAVTQGIYNRLTGDQALTQMLALYRGEPAIFTTNTVPGDAVLPYIAMAGELSDTNSDTKTTRMRKVIRSIRCYSEATGDAKDVEQIADCVRTLLHRHLLIVAGFKTIVADCSGSVAADQPASYGRIVIFRLTLEEV